MGLTMHSPGGIPGVSSSVIWNDTAASRQWASVHDPFYLGYAVVGGVSLAATGPAARVARPVGGWVVKQLGKPVLKGYRNPFAAYESINTTYTWVDRAILGMKIHQIVDGSSSQGLVQNGGPSAPLPLVQRGPLSDVLSLGKTLKTQSAHGRSPRSSAAAGGRRSYPMGEAFFEWDVNGRSYNPCARGYEPRKIKGRWHCVRKKR